MVLTTFTTRTDTKPSEMVDFSPGAATSRTGRNIRVVYDSGPFAPLCKNMASSTKPEVHNMLHSRKRKTEPRLQVTSTENLEKFGHVVFSGRELAFTFATCHRNSVCLSVCRLWRWCALLSRL